MSKDETFVQWTKIVLGCVALAMIFAVMFELDSIRRAVDSDACSSVRTAIK